MKIFGHPVHPLLIHFPTALLPMELFFSILAYAKDDQSFQLAGFYCLLFGVLLGAAAIVTGTIELVYMPKDNKKAMAAGIYHGFVNGTVIAVFAIMAYKGWQVYPNAEISSLPALVLKGILIFILFFGNYLGGQLIYKYFVGLKTNAGTNP